jgi:hypothetical protein
VETQKHIWRVNGRMREDSNFEEGRLKPLGVQSPYIPGVPQGVCHLSGLRGSNFPGTAKVKAEQDSAASLRFKDKS